MTQQVFCFSRRALVSFILYLIICLLVLCLISHPEDSEGDCWRVGRGPGEPREEMIDARYICTYSFVLLTCINKKELYIQKIDCHRNEIETSYNVVFLLISSLYAPGSSPGHDAYRRVHISTCVLSSQKVCACKLAFRNLLGDF